MDSLSTHTQAQAIWQSLPSGRHSHWATILYSLPLMPFVLLSFFLLLSHPANAALQEIKVLAQGTGDSREEAKANALTFAKQAAFIRIARKLDPEKAPAYLSKLDINALEPYIRGTSVLSEKRIDKLYVAEILVTVIDTPIRRAYGTLPTPAQLEKAAPTKDTRTILILPVFYNGVEPVVWDSKTNPSLKLWQTQAVSLTKNALIIPTGDTTDRSIVDRDNVLRASYNNFKPMLERYGSDEIVVAVLIDTLAKDQTQTVEMLLRRIRSGGQKVERFTLTPKSDTTPREAIYQQAVTEALHRMNTAAHATAYKEKKQRAKALAQPFVAQFNTLKEWADIQAILRKSKGIESISTTNLQLLVARGTLYINTDKKALLQSVAKGKVSISESLDGKAPWIIRIRK